MFGIHTLLYTEKVVSEATRTKKVLNERPANATSNRISASPKVTSLVIKRSYINSSGNDKENVPAKRKKNGVQESSQGATGSKTASKSRKSSRGHISSSLSKIDQKIINKIRVLSNGCSYMVDSAEIRFVNTCSFDSVAQVNS